MTHKRLVSLLSCAIFAALLCIFSPLAIYFGTIPVSLSLFAVLLCGVILPWKLSLLSVVLFLLLSLCGLPVFAGGNSGLTAIPGLTGGYIWSFVLVAPLVSFLSQNTPLEKITVFGVIISCIVAVLLCYFCGTLQFSLISGRTFYESLSICVIPFLLPDLLKIVIASVLGVYLHKILSANHVW